MTATCGWQPPAPSSCTNVYSRRQKEPNNFPPRSPKGEPGSESMDGGRGGEVRRETAASSAACSPICFASGLARRGRSGGGVGGCGLVGVRPRKCRMGGRGWCLTSWLFAFDEWGRKKKNKFPPNAQSQPEVKTTSLETMSSIHIRACMQCRVTSRSVRACAAPAGGCPGLIPLLLLLLQLPLVGCPRALNAILRPPFFFSFLTSNPIHEKPTPKD